MDVATDVISFPCPRCGADIAPSHDHVASCSCGWTGRAILFRPVALQVDAPEAALDDDATCMHHPDKRAIAVCAGTGDYICSLCAIEVEGTTYSAQYLEQGGKTTLRTFDQKLSRPDSLVILFILGIFVPLVNYIWVPAMPIWIPIAYYKIISAFRRRGTDPIFARVVTAGRLVTITVLLTLVTLFAVFAIFAIVIAIAEEM